MSYFLFLISVFSIGSSLLKIHKLNAVKFKIMKKSRCLRNKLMNYLKYSMYFVFWKFIFIDNIIYQEKYKVFKILSNLNQIV
jgi:hypothetical protein